LSHVPITRRLAAALALLTTLVHAGVGTFDTLYPGLRPGAPVAVTATLEAAWHLLGLFLAYSAWVFWRSADTARVLGALWIVSAAVFLLTGFLRGGPEGIFAVPQWTLLLLVGGLAVWPHRSPGPAGER